MSIYLYIAAMALTTYFIRMLPLTVFRKEIKNKFIRAFLRFIPVCCLTAMTVPAIFFATPHLISGIVAFLVAVALAFFKKSLVIVAAGCSLGVFLTELIITLI